LRISEKRERERERRGREGELWTILLRLPFVYANFVISKIPRRLPRFVCERRVFGINDLIFAHARNPGANGADDSPIVIIPRARFNGNKSYF
jgi:hypothetical protein